MLSSGHRKETSSVIQRHGGGVIQRHGVVIWSGGV
jgi:hypothetical protein